MKEKNQFFKVKKADVLDRGLFLAPNGKHNILMFRMKIKKKVNK